MWWREFRLIESRRPMAPTSADRPDARFSVGAAVRLAGRPERIRRVLKIKWHWHRQQFVFVVETSAPPTFESYWFAGQLVVAEPIVPN